MKLPTAESTFDGYLGCIVSLAPQAGRVVAGALVALEESPHSIGHGAEEISGRGNLPVGPQKYTTAQAERVKW